MKHFLKCLFTLPALLLSLTSCFPEPVPDYMAPVENLKIEDEQSQEEIAEHRDELLRNKLSEEGNEKRF